MAQKERHYVIDSYSFLNRLFLSTSQLFTFSDFLTSDCYMYDPPSFIRSTIRSVFFVLFCFFFDIRLLNSLFPKSDWNLSSPYSIIAESNIKVMRIRKIIREPKKLNAVIVKHILLVSIIWKVKKTVRIKRTLILGC